MIRLSYLDLERLHSGLFARLLSGTIDVSSYCDDWDGLVYAAGWTWEEVLDQIDGSWHASTSGLIPLDVC